MLVMLTYFKWSGKYYGQGEYETIEEDMFDIAKEVEAKLINRTLPGLIKNHSLFNVLINIPDHPRNYPMLIPLWKGL